jgi:diguanylate cyclase (GGDEF)-like protein
MSGADGHAAELIRLKQLFGWLTTAAAAFAGLAAVTAAFPGGRPGLRTSIVIALPVAIAIVLFWQLSARLLESLGQAHAERERLQVALGTMQENEEQFRSLAYHDDLTGLPNQRLFHDRLSVAIQHCAREKSRLAVLYFDLDGFKAVNDSLGHGLGDNLLVELSDRIRGSVRAEDTVARLGGDEFAVLLPQVAGPADAMWVSTKVLDALSAPFRFGSSEVSISASIGASLFPDDGASAEDLVRSADTAMYRAKHRGRAPLLPPPKARHDVPTEREALWLQNS